MPSSNTTSETEQYVSFVYDPNGRGTASLVLSCLLTLLLCVWQALHLNVPAQGQTTWQCIYSNIRWIIAGIYAPELVVFTAWRQWSSSKILSKSVISRLPQQTHAGKREKIGLEAGMDCDLVSRRWTKTHSFLASTGGFAFEIPENANDFLPLDCPRRLAITARGMVLLARCDRLPDVPVEEILDKSKANGLAKALVMIQATWMLLQAIGRLVAGLPVTLLEVNTIAHVLCALLMYIMWWHKPLLAKEPIIIRGDWVNSLCAFMLMSSEISGAVDEQALKSETAVKTLFASLHLYSKTPEFDVVTLRQDIENGGYMFQHSPQSCNKLVEAERECAAGDTAFFERRPRIVVTDQGENALPASAAEKIGRRWMLAALAVEEYPFLLKTQGMLGHNTDNGPCVHLKPEELVSARAQNWPGDDLLRNVGGLMVGMILWLSNLCFGGLHAAAWNEHFPSPAEKWLWRTSSLYIGFCGGFWILLNGVALRCKLLNDFWERWMDGEKSWLSNVGIGSLVVGCGGTLCLARCFIVVEAFVSIRSLPGSAYETPGWTQVVPHF